MRVPFLSRAPGSGSAAVAGVLVLTVGLTAVLGYQAVTAHRSHREVAEKTLREQAQVAAWVLGGASERALHGGFFLPGLDIVAKLGGKEPTRAFAVASELDQVNSERSWCWPECVRLLFRMSARGDVLDAVRPDSLGRPVALAPDDPELTEALGDVRAKAADGLDFHWDLAVRYLPDGRVLAWRRYHRSDGTGLYYGFVARDLEVREILTGLFADTPLLPPALTGKTPNAELLSARLDAPGAPAPLLDSDPGHTSPFSAAYALAPAFGGMRAEVALRESAAPALVIGGLPASRLPLILGLLALTVALLGISILQIRREGELARLRADFVSGVSHELRTPLAQIRMFSETLALGRIRDEGERDRSLGILVNETRRLTHVVDNVLLFSRSERSGMRLQREDTDLSALVREVSAGFEPLAAAARQRLEAEVTEGVAGRLDGGALRQAILNLLDNAVKYGPPGQTVVVGLGRAPGGRALLWVEDEGPGIRPDRRERVWEPYFRMEAHRESATAGSGIGLAVVRTVVEGHGGRARVEEGRTGGARFVLELVLDPETSAEVERERE